MSVNSDWNTQFNTLNNIPVNSRWDADGQNAYLKELAAKNPDQYKMPGVTPASQATSGLMSQTPSSNTGASYTFDDQARDRYGVTAPATSSPAVPSVAAPRTSHAPAGQPDNSLFTLANQQRNTPVSQVATNFTGDEPRGTGTGPGGTYTFDDQARDRYGAANTNEWTANMANAPPDLGAPSPWVHPMDEINRRLAERGFPPQTPAGTGGTGGTGAPPGLMTPPTPNTVAPVDGKIGYEARQLANPTKWNVDEDQTVEGRVRKLIAGNDQIQQMETTRAKQQMNENGTVNSSMGLQAVEAARYAAALPIATADAATYGRSAAYNADTQNQFAGKNVDASNTAFNATANIRANTARDTAQTIAQANLADKQGNIQAVAASNLAGVNAAAASKLAGVNAATAAQLAQTNTAAAVLKAQNDISVAAAGAVNEKALIDLKANLQKAQIGQEQSIEMSQELTRTINAINMNKDLNEKGKELQIDEAFKYANLTFKAIHYVSKMTGTLLEFEKEKEPKSPPNPTPPPPPNNTGGGNTGGTGGIGGTGSGGQFYNPSQPPSIFNNPNWPTH